MGVKVDLTRTDSVMRLLYFPPVEPMLVEVPEFRFLMIDGKGDPKTSPDYAAAIGALYSLSYPLKFAVRRLGGPDYIVMPLESLWWSYDMRDFLRGARSSWQWTAMIRQPAEVSDELLAAAIEVAEKRRPQLPLRSVRLESFAEGTSVEVMHRGPYSAEGPTIERLHAFIAAQGRELRGRHHEIYLGDPRRTAPERLRTVVRQPVTGIGRPAGA
jgi:hypothetical protein